MKFTDICLITNDVLRLAKFYKTIFGVKAEGDTTHVSVSVPDYVSLYTPKARP